MFHMLSISFEPNVLRISNTKRAARGPNEKRKAEENLIHSFRRSLSFYQDSEWNTCVWENGVRSDLCGWKKKLEVFFLNEKDVREKLENWKFTEYMLNLTADQEIN